MTKLLRLVLMGMLLVAPLSVMAADKVAIFIVNDKYQLLASSAESGRVLRTESAFREAGFQTLVVRNTTKSTYSKSMQNVVTTALNADKVVFIVSGHIVTAGTDSYLLNTDAARMNMLVAAGNAVPIDGLEALAATKPGAGIIALGVSQRAPAVGVLVEHGYVPETIPQGVSVFSGPAAQLAAFVEEQILAPGATTAGMAKNAPKAFTSFGFLSATTPFNAEDAVPAPSNTQSDRAAWVRAREAGSVEAIEGYLRQYPNGTFSIIAESLLEELRRSPEDIAKADEAALKLSRSARSDIQRDLTLLGYNTRGIDGIFGRGSRAAIQGWQTDRRFDVTGYMTGNQVAALSAQADVRAAELEDEARKRQEEQERADLSYWAQTGRENTEAGLRAYLRKYPDGLYAEIAKDRLDALEERKRERAAITEARDWDQALATNSIAAYQAYLKKYPDGAFQTDARDRIAALQKAGSTSDAIKAAAAQESRVLGSSAARMIVERKLNTLGLKPGRVDGVFDNDTRRAIRRFQTNAGLPVSGYVTQITMVRLLVAK